MERNEKNIPLIALFSKQSIMVEQLRSVRANLTYISEMRQIKTILFSSPEANEGKSTLVANLAVLFAERGNSVLLVDADLRNPSIHRAFQLANPHGLADWLNGEEQDWTTLTQASLTPGLSIITSGNTNATPSNLLDSVKMNAFLECVKNRYDFIFIDTTPMTAVSDAQTLSTKVDGTLMVVRENITKKKALKKAIHLLQLSGSNLLGIIYNGARKSVYSGYY